jgi:hypothetical protein
MRLLLLAFVFIVNSRAQIAGPLGPNGMFGDKLSDPDRWMAIVGDSGTTGAASAPDIEPTLPKLLGLLFDFFTDARVRRYSLGRVEPLTRVLYSRAEYKGAGIKLLLNAGAKLSLRLDVHEHGFGYLIGRALGLKARDIVLVGQDGVKIETIAEQFGRIYEMRTKTLPPYILLSYTANDLCDERVFDSSPEHWAEGFKDTLASTWREAEPFLKAHPRGTKIAVLAPLDVVGVMTNPGILSQKVNVEGQGEITCGELRRGETHFSLSSWMVLRMLNLMCPSVTSTRPEDGERLQRLRRVQELFSEAWKTQIDALNRQHEGKGLSWVYLESVRQISFSGGDVGNDCFHPSASGHAKLADAILHENVFN